MGTLPSLSTTRSTLSRDHTRYTRKHCISRRDNSVQGVAAHREAQGKPGRLANRAFRTRLLSRCFQWRRCDCQGLEAVCGYGRLGVLRFQSFRTKGCDRQAKGKIGMRFLSYRRREEGRGLDAVLPPAGPVVLRPAIVSPGKATTVMKITSAVVLTSLF